MKVFAPLISSLTVVEFSELALQYRNNCRNPKINQFLCIRRQLHACLTGIVPKQMWQPQNQSVSMFQVHVLQLMNDRLNTGFTEQEILSIFCDICEGMLLYYFRRHYKILLFKLGHNQRLFFFIQVLPDSTTVRPPSFTET